MGFRVKKGSEKGSQKDCEKGRPLGDYDPLGARPLEKIHLPWRTLDVLQRS